MSRENPSFGLDLGMELSVRIFKWFRATGDRFLDGFEENVISGPRSIRIFGKRFMESEMPSISVKVGEIFRQMFTIYHEFH